jgi:hypothetical protein
MSAPQVAAPAQILKAGEVIKAGALPDDLSIGGLKIWDLSSFGPAFVTVAFLMFMLVQMTRHWTFWRGTGKPLAVDAGLSAGTLAALKDLEVVAVLLLKVGVILFGAFLISRGLRGGATLAPSSFVAVVVVIAFAYLIEIVLQGVGVWGFKGPSGASPNTFHNCSDAAGANSFPLADSTADLANGDKNTMVCPFAALLQNNLYIFAHAITTYSLSWEALVLAAAMAAAKIGFSFY